MGIVTVYDQQGRYNRSRGETLCTRMLFIDELVRKIKKWRQKDKITILIMNANEDMNKL